MSACSVLYEELLTDSSISFTKFSDICPYCTLPGFRHSRRPAAPIVVAASTGSESSSSSSSPLLSLSYDSKVPRKEMLEALKTCRWSIDHVITHHYFRALEQLFTTFNVPEDMFGKYMYLSIPTTNTDVTWVFQLTQAGHNWSTMKLLFAARMAG